MSIYKSCDTCKFEKLQIDSEECRECGSDKQAHSNWQPKPIDTETPVIPCATETDAINSPSHYMQGGIETIDIIRTMLTKEEFQGYCKGNILKYRERAPYKGNSDQDYAKARKYKQFLEESENSD